MKNLKHIPKVIEIFKKLQKKTFENLNFFEILEIFENLIFFRNTENFKIFGIPKILHILQISGNSAKNRKMLYLCGPEPVGSSIDFCTKFMQFFTTNVVYFLCNKFNLNGFPPPYDIDSILFI